MPDEKSTLSILKVQDPENLDNTIITITGEGSIDAGGHDRHSRVILRDEDGNERILLEGEDGDAYLGGNVGIGIRDPQANLDVGGLTRTEDLTVPGTIQNPELEDLKDTVAAIQDQLASTPDNGEETESDEQVTTRNILQATYTPKAPDPDQPLPTSGRGLEKSAFIAHLKPSQEELEELAARYETEEEPGAGDAAERDRATQAIEVISREIAQTGRIDVLRSAKHLADVDANTLAQVAKDLIEHRQEMLNTVAEAHKVILEQSTQANLLTTGTGTEAASTAPGRGSVRALTRWALKNDIEAESARKTLALGRSLSLRMEAIGPAQFKVLAARQIDRLRDLADSFDHFMGIEPVGYLHLERVGFSPAGIERGELVYTVPLSPGEEVNITHREWSHTSEEFEQIVTDYLEEFSEEGVAEKSELARAVESQTQHSSAFNTSVTASGGSCGVNFSSSLSHNVSDSASKSEKSSRNQTKEVTHKASSRAKKEHKMSFKVASAYETEDQSVRKIKNPFPDRATRVDYYQLIRKWKVDLYRYGIRLTWDFNIPEPGAGLESRLREIQQIKAALELGIESPITADNVTIWPGFNLKPEQLLPATEIEDDSEEMDYLGWAAKYGAILSEEDEPDESPLPRSVSWVDMGQQTDRAEIKEVSFEVSPEYEIQEASCRYGGSPRFDGDGNPLKDASLNVIDLTGGTILFRRSTKKLALEEAEKKENVEEELARLRKLNGLDPDDPWPDMLVVYRIATPEKWVGRSGTLKLAFRTLRWNDTWVSIDLQLQIKQLARRTWQQRVWGKIQEAAEGNYLKCRQFLKDRLARLEEELGAQDALSLRKKEREEVMKGVLRWIGIKDFEFFPEDIPLEGEDDEDELDIEEALYDLESGLVWNEEIQKTVYQHGKIIKFLHHAIEWENMLYFLYPYFWCHPTRWEFKKYLDHPDPMHRAFLKAGSARVVLTIRPGFEEAFLAFIEKGDLDAIPSEPYLSIGQEFENYAKTNYPGIPPANPVKNFRPLLHPVQRKTWEDMQILMELLEEYREANGDSYPPPLEDPDDPNSKTWIDAIKPYADTPASVPVVDGWGNPWVYSYPGVYGEYDLASYGVDEQPGGEGEDADITSWAEASLIGTWYEYTPTSALDIAFDEGMPTA